jgi:phosphoenolpyruvate---glycerone phosphotransferase subunit DhaL
MQYFLNSEGSVIILNIIRIIQKNKDYLSEVDGAIGDGDHGINMNKGFSMAAERINGEHNFSDAANILGNVLMMEIGGSMGPLYGTFFKTIYRETKNFDIITAEVYRKMFQSALIAVKLMGDAEIGDKTLIDTLSPAIHGFSSSLEKKPDFTLALTSSVESASIGRDSTKYMIARIGRSARLGERSRGVLDAGAVSSCLIVEAMNTSIIEIMKSE